MSVDFILGTKQPKRGPPNYSVKYCVKGGTHEPRARQNVLLELGFFIGHLGRDKVCALKKGAVEIPSDFAGVVWESMDDNNGWKQSLCRELEAAGHIIDWNKVMR